ncbi:MAG: ATP-binding protein [Spirochaetia bacterium]
MKIRTTFLLNMLFFGIILVIVCVSVLVTNIRVGFLREQEEMAHNIERSAGDLVFLSHEYILYGENQLFLRWKRKFSGILHELAGLKPDTAQAQVLVNTISESCRRVKNVFENVLSSRKAGSSLMLTRLSFNRMSVQNKGLIFNAERLTQLLREQAEDMRFGNDILIYIMYAVFILYFLVNYILFYRRTLASITRLQTGTEAVGKGDLSFRIPAGEKDEIGDLSRAFNRMAADLKEITASKKDLENEIAIRKKAEDALRVSEERYATTLSSIGDAVISTDVKGTVIFMNKVAEELTGWSLKEALGKNSNRVFRIINENTRGKIPNPIDEVLKKGKIVGLTNHTILIRKDGTEIPIGDSGAPIKDRSNRVSGVVLVFRDITERRNAEEVLKRDKESLERLVQDKTRELLAAEQEVAKAKRLSDIGMLSSFVAHELRNPLAGITAALYNIQRKAGDAPIERHIESIRKKITESEQIINNLLFYARIKQPQMQDSNIDSIIKDCVNAVRENTKKKILINMKTTHIRNTSIMVDPLQIKEVFQNVINNACDALLEETGTIDIEAKKESDHISIQFTDNGQGIETHVLEKIFDPFFTTKAKGTGLGLPVCSQIIRLHEGKIAIESRPGQGTCVLITLPRKQGQK